ncbi:MAG: tetratricopeptide repeat protein [Bacteroidetes bacterium]|nr:tetratricopeptide repeat protein [Bacteroidota bacterium]
MNLRYLFVFIFLLALVIESCSAAQEPGISENQNSANWSVLRQQSELDSLIIDLKSYISSGETQFLKEFIKDLQFRNELKAADNFIPVIPVSAGIYQGSLASDSLSAFDQLIFLYRILGDRNAEAEVLNSYAVNHALNGRMDDAIRLLNDAIVLNLEINNRIAVRNNYLILQRINRYRGYLGEALKYNQAILLIDQDSKNNQFIADSYMDHAEILTSQKKFAEAETMVLRKALPLYYYGLKDKNGTIRCYNQLADTYHQQKKFTQAKWFYIQSNMLARKINSPFEIVNSLINLANVKMSIGDYELALSDFKEAEQLSVKNSFTLKLIEIKSDLALVHRKLGNSTAANASFSEFKVMKETFLRTIQ